MFRTVPLYIIRSFFHCTHNNGKCHTGLLCVQWKNSWWWTEELSETCRVLFQKLKQIWGTSACSWVKRDQLDVTCFIISLLNAQHVSDVNTSILRSLRLICWVISWLVLLWFDVCWCYVVVWLGWCGIRMQTEALVLQPAYGYHTTLAKPCIILIVE